MTALLLSTVAQPGQGAVRRLLWGLAGPLRQQPRPWRIPGRLLLPAGGLDGRHGLRHAAPWPAGLARHAWPVHACRYAWQATGQAMMRRLGRDVIDDVNHYDVIDGPLSRKDDVINSALSRRGAPVTCVIFHTGWSKPFSWALSAWPKQACPALSAGWPKVTSWAAFAEWSKLTSWALSAGWSKQASRISSAGWSNPFCWATAAAGSPNPSHEPTPVQPPKHESFTPQWTLRQKTFCSWEGSYETP